MPIKAVPTFATVRRAGDSVTLRAKLPDVDPATLHATLIDGELVVTARAMPPAGTRPAPAGDATRHRLIDLGPGLEPVLRTS